MPKYIQINAALIKTFKSFPYGTAHSHLPFCKKKKAWILSVFHVNFLQISIDLWSSMNFESKQNSQKTGVHLDAFYTSSSDSQITGMPANRKNILTGWAEVLLIKAHECFLQTIARTYMLFFVFDLFSLHHHKVGLGDVP